MQAVAISSGDSDTIAAISNIQARLLFVGPMTALEASQQAAKNNGIIPNDAFSEYLREHADKVRFTYPSTTGPNGESLFPEPYENAWQEYAAMLYLIADEGVSAGPDNMRLYGDIDGGHILYDIGFYDAIAGHTWCWFYHNAPTLVQDYRNFFPVWWNPLPEPPLAHPRNSEIYSLNLIPMATHLRVMPPTRDALNELADERDYNTISTNAMTSNAVWYVYAPGSWHEWEAMSEGGSNPFPLTGPVLDKYNYSGADAAVRIETTTQRLTPGPGGSVITNSITWTAAAKPFGYLPDNQRPIDYALVLPAFHDIRLIPMDASSAPAEGGFNLQWREHITEHLPLYMNSGPHALSSGCYYCRQLKTWENTAFRQAGVDWLRDNSGQCTISGGGGSRGGGRRHGH